MSETRGPRTYSPDVIRTFEKYKAELDAICDKIMHPEEPSQAPVDLTAEILEHDAHPLLDTPELRPEPEEEVVLMDLGQDEGEDVISRCRRSWQRHPRRVA